MLTRQDIVIPFITGKKVLDCGGAHYTQFDLLHDRGLWFHDTIRDNAGYVLGVDIDKDAVKYLNDRNYNFRVMDVQNMEFKEEFEVVTGGELIEHLELPSLFLRSAFRALVPGGLLIITTPNVYGLKFIARYTILKNELVHPDHVAAFTPKLLCQLLTRCGFAIKEVAICAKESHRKSIKFIKLIISELVPHLGEQLVVIAQKPD